MPVEGPANLVFVPSEKEQTPGSKSWAHLTVTVKFMPG
jgi:hypothetical protein